jgi:hypothetical protein
LECSVPDEGQEADRWPVISRPESGLTTIISEAICDSPALNGSSIRSLRNSSQLLMLSDYGGAHKGARYEVFSYLTGKYNTSAWWLPAQITHRDGS